MVGIPLPSSFFEINLGCNLLKNQIIGGMSHKLWWLEIIMTGLFLGSFSENLNRMVVPTISKLKFSKPLKVSTLTLWALYPKTLKHNRCMGSKSNNINPKKK